MRLCAIVEVVRRGDRRLIAPLEGAERVDQLLGVREGERTNEDRVHDAEHRAVRADADA